MSGNVSLIRLLRVVLSLWAYSRTAYAFCPSRPARPARILVNVKLLFFSPAVSLKNIPFEGVITEADSGKIVVKGDGTNGCGLTEHYQIYNSDQIKIVNTNDELIQFTDLKKGTRISMRLWIKEKTLYNDMDRLDIVTLIQCCE